MRALRDPLTAGRIALAAAGGLAVMVARADVPPLPDAQPSPYYPLAVGNSWTYRCSAEGSRPFEKTLKLTAATVQDGRRFYRAEMRIRADPKPLVSYLYTGSAGEVLSMLQLGKGEGEVLVTRAPRTGDRVGERVAVVGEPMRIPALGKVSVVRVENFGRDDPTISEQRRMEWSGRYFARGVGLVAEADGLGGECVLTRHRVGLRR